MSRVVVITPPAAVVSLADMRTHLRVDFSEDDALIAACVAAATGFIDGPDGWLGRAIGSQTLEWRDDTFPLEELVLPYPPLTSVGSVKYVDPNGDEQTFSDAGYAVAGQRLVLKSGEAWPSISTDPESVRVRYVAGYATVPAGITAAIKLMAADLYHNRETAGPSVMSENNMLPAARRLLHPFRVWG